MIEEEIEKQARMYIDSIDTLIYDLDDRAINIAFKQRQAFKDGAKWGMETICKRILKKAKSESYTLSDYDTLEEGVIDIKDLIQIIKDLGVNL